MMARTRTLSIVRWTLLILSVLAIGEGSLAHALGSDEPSKTPPIGARIPAAAKTDEPNKKPTPGRMFIVGRVVDPTGKPVPGASVMVYARSKTSGPARGSVVERLYPKEVGRAASDGSGQFRIEAPRISSSSHEKFGAVALATGQALSPTSSHFMARSELLQGTLDREPAEVNFNF